MPPNKKFFDIFNLKYSYFINKQDLKNKYFQLSKNKVDPILNKAYSTLNDDFERAKLLYKPSSVADVNFLNNMLKLETRIRNGEDLSSFLNNKIEECKNNLNEDSVMKWGYFRRLLKLK